MSGKTEITRTRHRRQCEACEGGGEIVVNNTNPYGYGPDPQCDEPFECAECYGKGRITVWIDPLVKLRAARRRRSMTEYEIVRLRAMCPVSGLAQADMLAMARMCVTATERLQAAFRAGAAA